MNTSRPNHESPVNSTAKTFTIKHGVQTNHHQVKILHTSDWQLGMERWFLDNPDSDSLALFSEARYAAIEKLAQVAREKKCDVVVVAGDVFDAPQVRPRSQARLLEAMDHFDVPVLFLPGNHDPYRVGSVWQSSFATDLKAKGAHIVADSEPFEVAGAKFYGAPLTSNTANSDLVADALAGMEAGDGISVLIGHGQPGRFSADHKLSDIDVATVEKALNSHVVDYVAMGDTHSTMQIDSVGGMWFSGAHEVTDFDDRERDSGNVLVVDIELGGGETTLTVESVPVGTWNFVEMPVEITTETDIDSWWDELDSLPVPSRTAIRYSLRGQVSVEQYSRIQAIIENASHSFAAFFPHKRHMDLTILPDDMDIQAMGLGGYLREAALQLDTTDPVDVDALSLLFRLSGAMDSVISADRGTAVGSESHSTKRGE